MIRIDRRTSETTVEVIIGAAGDGAIATSVPFLDHMLTAFSRYSGLSLSVRAQGDLRHHLIEDVAIGVGLAVGRAVPEACARFGEATIPMDDALVQTAIDVGGRSFYAGRLPSTMYDHWMRSFADAAKSTLHVRVIRGRDRHHVVEAAFKSLGMSVRQALVETDALLSTKGRVSLAEVG